MGIIRNLINQQVAFSNYFDKRWLPKKFLIDGNDDFLKNILPCELNNMAVGSTIYDVGCGKKPAISLEIKRKLQVKIIGIDLSESELLQAPPEILDSCIVADIGNYLGKGDADLLICQALLEHVPNVNDAFQSMSSILHKGGAALIFVPSRNAVFARLNIALPQKLKLFLLHSIFPNTRKDQGFPSFYNRCTPHDFQLLAVQHHFVVEEMRTYYKSSYFSFFFPLYLIWRLWIVLFEKIDTEQSAETFYIKLRRV